MDIRNAKWFAQLQVSGVGKPENHNGSIMGCIAEILKDLHGMTPRVTADGAKEIVIRIRDKPFSNTKESGDLERILDVAAQIDDSQMIGGPREGERYDNFVQRLMDDGLTHIAAEVVAADWYDKGDHLALTEWINDSKAIRFRLLNCSREAYESASPSEYAELKRYVIERFPAFTAGITFRTA